MDNHDSESFNQFREELRGKLSSKLYDKINDLRSEIGANFDQRMPVSEIISGMVWTDDAKKVMKEINKTRKNKMYEPTGKDKLNNHRYEYAGIHMDKSDYRSVDMWKEDIAEGWITERRLKQIFQKYGIKYIDGSDADLARLTKAQEAKRTEEVREFNKDMAKLEAKIKKIVGAENYAHMNAGSSERGGYIIWTIDLDKNFMHQHPIREGNVSEAFGLKKTKGLNRPEPKDYTIVDVSKIRKHMKKNGINSDAALKNHFREFGAFDMQKIDDVYFDGDYVIAPTESAGSYAKERELYMALMSAIPLSVFNNKKIELKFERIEDGKVKKSVKVDNDSMGKNSLNEARKYRMEFPSNEDMINVALHLYGEIDPPKKTDKHFTFDVSKKDKVMSVIDMLGRKHNQYALKPV